MQAAMAQMYPARSQARPMLLSAEQAEDQPAGESSAVSSAAPASVAKRDFCFTTLPCTAEAFLSLKDSGQLPQHECAQVHAKAIMLIGILPASA